MAAAALKIGHNTLSQGTWELPTQVASGLRVAHREVGYIIAAHKTGSDDGSDVVPATSCSHTHIEILAAVEQKLSAVIFFFFFLPQKHFTSI